MSEPSAICSKCLGLIMEPNTHYGYAGKVCQCDLMKDMPSTRYIPMDVSTDGQGQRDLIRRLNAEIRELKEQLITRAASPSAWKPDEVEVKKQRKDIKPSLEAQKIRSRIAFDLDANDNSPDWLWDIVDIAAQAGINQTSQSEWQPISSAPKDGTSILLWLVDYAYVAFFNQQTKHWDDGDWNDDLGNPTHWKPITPPNNHNREGA